MSVTILRPEEGQDPESYEQELRQASTHHRDDFHDILKGDHDAALKHLEAARQKLNNAEKALRHFKLVSEDVWPHAQPLRQKADA